MVGLEITQHMTRSLKGVVGVMVLDGIKSPTFSRKNVYEVPPKNKLVAVARKVNE
jgi:hypothetical protein